MDVITDFAPIIIKKQKTRISKSFTGILGVSFCPILVPIKIIGKAKINNKIKSNGKIFPMEFLKPKEPDQ